MAKVKICGLTNIEDVRIINKYLPDYVGFVFAPSKRQITIKQAGILAKQIAPEIKKVGVFVNCPREYIEKAAKACDLDVLQFHGQESAQNCQGYTQEVWKCFRIRDTDSLATLQKYQVDGILIDSYFPGTLGGTGKTFDWSLVSHLADSYFFILAGGLNANNVQQAIYQVNPDVIDVSSSIETKNIKDEAKTRDFIRKVRQAK